MSPFLKTVIENTETSIITKMIMERSLESEMGEREYEYERNKNGPALSYLFVWLSNTILFYCFLDFMGYRTLP